MQNNQNREQFLKLKENKKYLKEKETKKSLFPRKIVLISQIVLICFLPLPFRGKKKVIQAFLFVCWEEK